MRTGLLYTTIAALAALTFPACSDDNSGTTAAQPTTGPVLPGTTSTTTDDGGSTSTTTEDNATTDVIGSTSSPTTGEPSDPDPVGCLNPEIDDCSAAPQALNFCGYVAQACIDHGIDEVYCGIVGSMCRENQPPCDVCWHLENYCSQVGEDCDGLMLECACVGEATVPKMNDTDCGEPGGLFGPCNVHGCDWPLACTSTASGKMCIPTKFNFNNDPGAALCAAEVGSEILCDEPTAGWCVIGCDGGCGNGSHCDSNSNTCVYDPPPGCHQVGGIFGPCDGGTCSSPLTCETSDAGSICLPSADESTAPGVVVCGNKSGTVNCDGDLCRVACDFDVDCAGGMVCDTNAGQCVWGA